MDSPFAEVPQPPPRAGARSASDKRDTQTVVAEGVGLTPDESFKDALRTAVRQVVGTVVDAETLVRNDDLIKDQILTYSDGFVPRHKQLSQKQEGDLWRTTIRATVERR